MIWNKKLKMHIATKKCKNKIFIIYNHLKLFSNTLIVFVIFKYECKQVTQTQYIILYRIVRRVRLRARGPLPKRGPLPRSVMTGDKMKNEKKKNVLHAHRHKTNIQYSQNKLRANRLPSDHTHAHNDNCTAVERFYYRFYGVTFIIIFYLH